VLVVWQIELDFPKGVVSRYSLAVVFLLVLLIISALAVVYSSHYSRELFHELKLKKQTRDDLETEWGQLLLEQSALSAHTRVESAADRYLNMMLPESKDIKLVISNGR
jgi:cell division protein FtsL